MVAWKDLEHRIRTKDGHIKAWLRKWTDRVRNSNKIRRMFKLEWYFTQGKGLLAKAYDPMNDVSALVVLLTFWLGYDLTQNRSGFGIFLLILFVLLIVVGWFRDNSGLYHSEIAVVTNQNHVQKEMYEAAVRINKWFYENDRQWYDEGLQLHKRR